MRYECKSMNAPWGTRGTVLQCNELMARVQFDNSDRVDWVHRSHIRRLLSRPVHLLPSSPVSTQTTLQSCVVSGGGNGDNIPDEGAEPKQNDAEHEQNSAEPEQNCAESDIDKCAEHEANEADNDECAEPERGDIGESEHEPRNVIRGDIDANNIITTNRSRRPVKRYAPGSDTCPITQPRSAVGLK